MCKARHSLQRRVLLFSLVMSRRCNEDLAVESEVMEYVRRIASLVNEFSQSFYVLRGDLFVEGEFYELECARAELQSLLYALVEMGEMLNGNALLFRQRSNWESSDDQLFAGYSIKNMITLSIARS